MPHTLLSILPFLLFGGQILAQLGGHFKINVTTRDSGAPGSGCIILAQLPTSSDPNTDAITAMKPICPLTAPNPSAADDQQVEWPLSSHGDGAESSLAIFGDLPGGDGDTSRPGCIMKLSQMQVAYLLGRDLQWNSSVGEVWDFTGVGTLLDPLSFAIMKCQSTQPPMAEHLNLPNPNAHKSDSSIWWTSLTVGGLGEEVAPTQSQSPASTTSALDDEEDNQSSASISEEPASTTSFRFIGVETPVRGSDSEGGQVEPTDVPAAINSGTSSPTNGSGSDGQSTGSEVPGSEPTNPPEIPAGDTTTSDRSGHPTSSSLVTTNTVVSGVADTTANLSLPHKEVVHPLTSTSGKVEESQHASTSEDVPTSTAIEMDPTSGSNTTSSRTQGGSSEILVTSLTSPATQPPADPTRGPFDNQPSHGVETTTPPDPPQSTGRDSDNGSSTSGAAPTDSTDASGLASSTGSLGTLSSSSFTIEWPTDRTPLAAPTREVPIQISVPESDSGSLDTSSSESEMTLVSPTVPGTLVDPLGPTTAPFPSETVVNSTSGFMIAISTVNKAKDTIISLRPTDETTLDGPTSSISDSISVSSTLVLDSSSSGTTASSDALSTASSEIPSPTMDPTGGTSGSDSSIGGPDLTSILRPIVPTTIPHTTPQSSDSTSESESNAIPTTMETDVPAVTSITSSTGSQAMCCNAFVPLDQRDLTTVTYTATTTCVPCATDYIGSAQISGTQVVAAPEDLAAGSTLAPIDDPSRDQGNDQPSAELSDEATIIEATQIPDPAATSAPFSDLPSGPEAESGSEVGPAEVNPTPQPPPPFPPTPTTSPFDVPTFDPAAPFRELGFFPFSSSLRLSQRQRGGGHGGGAGRGGNGYHGGGGGNWGGGGYAGGTDDSSRQGYAGQAGGEAGIDNQSGASGESAYYPDGTAAAGTGFGQKSGQTSVGSSVGTYEPSYEGLSSQADDLPSQQPASTYRETSSLLESVSTRSIISSSASSHVPSASTRPSVLSTTPKQTISTSSIGYSNAAQSQDGDSDSGMSSSSSAQSSSGANHPTSSDDTISLTMASTPGEMNNTFETSSSSSSSRTTVPTSSSISSADSSTGPAGGFTHADTEVAAISSSVGVPPTGSPSSSSQDPSSTISSSSSSEEEAGSTASTRSFLASPTIKSSNSHSFSGDSPGGVEPSSSNETPSTQQTTASPSNGSTSSVTTSISSSRSLSQEVKTVPSSSPVETTSFQSKQSSVPNDEPSQQQPPPPQTTVERSTSADQTTRPSDTPRSSPTFEPSKQDSSPEPSPSPPPTQQEQPSHTEPSTSAYTSSPESSSEQSPPTPPSPSEQAPSPPPTNYSFAPPTSQEVHESSSSAPPPAPSPENQPPPSPTDDFKPEESPSPTESHQDPTPSSPVFTDAGITIAQFITSVLPTADEHTQADNGDNGGEEGESDVTTIGQFTPTGEIPGLAQATQTLAAIKRKRNDGAGTNGNVRAASAIPAFDVSQRPVAPHRRRRQARWRRA